MTNQHQINALSFSQLPFEDLSAKQQELFKGEVKITERIPFPPINPLPPVFPLPVYRTTLKTK